MDADTQDALLHEIRRDVKDLGTSSATLATRVDGVERRLGNVEGKMDALAVLISRFEAVQDRLEAVEPKIESLDRWQSRVIGGAAVIAAFAGGLAGTFARLIAGTP